MNTGAVETQTIWTDEYCTDCKFRTEWAARDGHDFTCEICGNDETPYVSEDW